MKSKELVEITIDFDKLRKDRLNEGFFRLFGFWIKQALQVLLGDINVAVPVKIKGTPTEVRSFVGALKKEKSYIEAYRNFGLDDPKTFKSKSQLRSAVRNFESKTGLDWPFER